MKAYKHLLPTMKIILWAMQDVLIEISRKYSFELKSPTKFGTVSSTTKKISKSRSPLATLMKNFLRGIRNRNVSFPCHVAYFSILVALMCEVRGSRFT